MARRRRTDLWEDLFDSLRCLFTIIHPAWSILLAAIFFFGALAWFRYKVTIQGLEGLAYLVGGLPAFISLAADFAGWRLRRERARFFAKAVDLDRIRQLPWQQFERRVADVYRHRGYAVENTGGGGADGGVDLRLRRDGRETLVQCKQWRVYKVGVKPVRELYGVMAAEGAAGAVLITSGVFTDEARAFAGGKPIELIGGEELAAMLGDVQVSLFPASARDEPGRAGSIPEGPPSLVCPGVAAPPTPSCPRCGAAMALRRATKGANAGAAFWGCSQFPRCRGIRRLAEARAALVGAAK